MAQVELTQKAKINEYLNDRLYFDKYFIRRIKVTKHLHVAMFSSAVKYEFNICEIEDDEKPHNTLEQFIEFHSPNGSTHVQLESVNLSNEIDTHVRDIKSQKIYFFNKAFLNEKELPLFYGLLYLNDTNTIDDDNRETNHYEDFLVQRDNELLKHVYSQKLKPSYLYEHFGFVHYYGDAIELYFACKDSTLETKLSGSFSLNGFEDFSFNYPDELTVQSFLDGLCAFTEYWKERAIRADEPALGSYIIAVTNSFASFLKDNMHVSECTHCKRLIRYKKGKLYCSMGTEARDCGRSARNQRSYSNRKKNPTET